MDSGDNIHTALKNAREYCIANGIHSFIIDKWEDVLDMYLEEFSYFDDFKRHIYVEATEKATKKATLKTKIETALNALSEGASPEFISKICGLSVDEVKKLAQT